MGKFANLLKYEKKIHANFKFMVKMIAASLIVLFQVQSHAFITINVNAELLKTAGGSAMPTTGLVILVADTLVDGFGGPTAGAFVSADDFLVKKWDLSAFGTAGVLGDTTGSLTLSGNWTAGDPLKLYWFPTLDINSSGPGAGTSYGQYRDPVSSGGSGTGRDSSDPWFTPADGSLAITLNFYTSDATFLPSSPGANPTSPDFVNGNANLTVVPEPSAYATVFGIVCLIGAVASRRFSKSQARS